MQDGHTRHIIQHHPLPITDSAKYLGITLSNGLKWNTHTLCNITSKADSRCIKKVKKNGMVVIIGCQVAQHTDNGIIFFPSTSCGHCCRWWLTHCHHMPIRLAMWQWKIYFSTAKQTAITDKGQGHAANWTHMWNTLQAPSAGHRCSSQLRSLQCYSYETREKAILTQIGFACSNITSSFFCKNRIEEKNLI